MALNILHVESFDGGTHPSHFGFTTGDHSVAGVRRKTWSGNSGVGLGSIVTGFTGNGWKGGSYLQGFNELKADTGYAGHATWVVVYRVYWDNPTFGGDGWNTIYLLEMDNSLNQQGVFEFRNDGSIRARRGNAAQDNNGALLQSTAAGICTPQTWHLIEARLTIADSPTGAWNLKVDGVEVLNGTGDTYENYGTSNPLCGYVKIGANSASPNAIIDDVLMADGGGSTTAYPGAIRIYSRRPTANSEVQGVPSSGANWETVDETGQDDTDYVLFRGAGKRDLYDFAALGVTGTVHAVQLTYRCAWTGPAGSSSSTAKLSGVEVDGDARTTPSETANTFGEPQVSQVWTEKPGGGSWTVSDVDTATFGPKRRGAI